MPFLAFGVITLVGCSFSLPSHYQVPSAERADAKPAYEAWTYVVAPPVGASWALSGSVTYSDFSSLRCDLPPNLRASLLTVGALADELHFCLTSGVKWSKVYWEEPSEHRFPQRWGLTVARLDLAGSGLVDGDSVWSARLLDSLRAAEAELGVGTSWQSIEATMTEGRDARYQVLHFIGHKADESVWVAMKMRREFVFVVISRDQPSPGSEALRVLQSVREWATHHGVYWGVITDVSGHPVASAAVSAGTSAGEVRTPVPCAAGCGLSGPDGRYRLHVFLGGAAPVTDGRRFWLVASPGGRAELRVVVDTLPLPGPLGQPLDSTRVDFVLSQ